MGRKKKLENQSELIVEAAKQLFNQYGFAKTTLDDIAREVGIGKATLYSDFSSKDEILNAVIQKNQQQALENMRTIIKKSKAGPLKTLHDVLLQDVLFVFENMRRHFQDTDPTHPVSMLRGRITATSFFQTSLDEKAAVMAELLDEAVKTGLIEPLADSINQIRMIRISLMGIQPAVLPEHKEKEVRQAASDLIDLMLSGLKLPRHKLDEPIHKAQ